VDPDPQHWKKVWELLCIMSLKSMVGGGLCLAGGAPCWWTSWLCSSASPPGSPSTGSGLSCRFSSTKRSALKGTVPQAVLLIRNDLFRGSVQISFNKVPNLYIYYLTVLPMLFILVIDVPVTFPHVKYRYRIEEALMLKITERWVHTST
jgi:hypothetical protein